MNTFQRSAIVLAMASASLLLTACASAPTAPPGAAQARQKLSQLQADPELATRAPVAIKEAEVAVAAAEQPRSEQDMEQGVQLVYIADRKVDIAQARAQTRLWEDQREQLSDQREDARLDSRTEEADNLRAQIAALNAKETERGLVITLGDLLFATGRAELKAGTAHNLDKLAAFLKRYPDRNVIIEGHTDSVGSDDSNFALSQRRAESVRGYLMSEGIEPSRISASGKGEGSPVATNRESAGRQMNRRVEIVIVDTATAQK